MKDKETRLPTIVKSQTLFQEELVISRRLKSIRYPVDPFIKLKFNPLALTPILPEDHEFMVATQAERELKIERQRTLEKERIMQAIEKSGTVTPGWSETDFPSLNEPIRAKLRMSRDFNDTV